MRFAGLVERLGIPQPAGGMASSSEEALVVAERGRLSGHRSPIVRDRRPGSRLRLRARGPGADHRPRRCRRRRAAGAHRRVPGGAGAGRRCDHGRSRRVDPGPAWSTSRRPGFTAVTPSAFTRRSASASADQQLVVDAITRVALAVGVRGLINGQFIIRDDGVYLLEVNPRASRTVPFLSKVTGVPMVELATRVALGETPGRPGLGERCRSAALPRRCQGAGLLDHEAARRRSDAGPGDAVDRRGDRLARRRAGGDGKGTRRRFVAAAGCARRRNCAGPALDRRSRQGPAGRAGVASRQRGLPVLRHVRHGDGTPRSGSRRGGGLRVGAGGTGRSVVDAIASGDVLLVVNTPSPESRPVRDAGAIRMAATAEGILCLTSIDTALAAAAALDPAAADHLGDVRPLDTWLEPRSSVTP